MADATVQLAERALDGDVAAGVRRAVADRTHDLRRAVAVRRQFAGNGRRGE